MSFLSPAQIENEEQDKKWLMHKSNKRQEVRVRVKEQQRQWALESERVLESLVSRIDPEIGLHVRRGFRGKQRRVKRRSPEITSKESLASPSSLSSDMDSNGRSADNSDSDSQLGIKEDREKTRSTPHFPSTSNPLLVISRTPQVIDACDSFGNCRLLRKRPSRGPRRWRGRWPNSSGSLKIWLQGDRRRSYGEIGSLRMRRKRSLTFVYLLKVSRRRSKTGQWVEESLNLSALR